MYILIKPEQVKRRGFYETMPDGRAILPFSDLKMLGTVKDVDVIATSRELKSLIKEQKDSGLYDKPEEVDPGFSIDPQPKEEIDSESVTEPCPETEEEIDTEFTRTEIDNQIDKEVNNG